jgi:hypothetical protein
MTEEEQKLGALIQAERLACTRAERLRSYRSTMLDEGVRAAALQLCRDARAQLTRFLRAHPAVDPALKTKPPR